jgi:hypothetical protein
VWYTRPKLSPEPTCLCIPSRRKYRRTAPQARQLDVSKLHNKEIRKKFETAVAKALKPPVEDAALTPQEDWEELKSNRNEAAKDAVMERWRSG